MKHTLSRTIGRSLLEDVHVNIEISINNRPLSYQGEKFDSQPLTPNMPIFGGNVRALKLTLMLKMKDWLMTVSLTYYVWNEPSHSLASGYGQFREYVRLIIVVNCFAYSCLIFVLLDHKQRHKGPVKLIKQVKIAHSFLQSVSDQFHVIILSLPM